MRRFFLFLICIATLNGCGDDKPTTGDDKPKTPKFDVSKLRSAIVKDMQTPATNQFVKSVDELNDKIISFSNQVNSQNLTALKKAWKKAAYHYGSIEPFNIGQVYDTYIYTALYSWGAKGKKINEYIGDATKTIDQTKINSLPTNYRGLSAIEFLLFDKPSAQTITDFSESRRLEYLKNLGENLKSKAGKLKTSWDSFAPQFIENDNTGLGGSINMIVNQMNLLLEDVKSLKVGKPAGLEKKSIKSIGKLQAERSGYSLDIVKANISGLRSIYFGKSDGLGIKDYVLSMSKSQRLNDKIKSEFDALETAIDQIKTPLKDTLNDNFDKVKTLYDSVKNLIRLVKIDLASTLSITITFSDNDGDS